MANNHLSCERTLSNGNNGHADLMYTYEDIARIQNYLQNITAIKPRVGIICGSGLGTIAEIIAEPTSIDYKDIPNFPRTTAPGHLGRLTFGHISQVPVVCMQGRFHYYEGYPLSTCIMPVRLMKLLGVSYLIVSNAAGAANQAYKVGDIMLQKDHFNIMALSGIGPLIGFNDPRWGSRFISMVGAYDPDLLKAAKNIAKTMGIAKEVHEGVYACTGGPTFETVAEIRYFRSIGVDALGMSTVHEVTAARHCDMKCFAFSLITNICPAEYENAERICGEGVIDAAQERQGVLKVFVEKMLQHIKDLKE